MPVQPDRGFFSRIPRLARISITGQSMKPFLNDGDWVLALITPAGLGERRLRRSLGQVVLVRRRVEPDLLTIKRLVKVIDIGYWVEGDSPEDSTDSRQYLTIEASEMVGRLLFRYRRKTSE